MYLLAAALNSYVTSSLKSEPTEVCTSMCHNSLKGPSKINDAIKTLQKKYNKIIKDFDTSKPNKVVVTYWKVELPEGQAPTDQVPDWEFVRNIVEGSIPYQAQYKLFLIGEADTQAIAEKAVNQFLQQNSVQLKNLRDHQGVKFEIKVKASFSKGPAASNNSKKTIVFDGLLKDKLELEGLRYQFKRFIDRDQKRSFLLFPPMVKRPKKSIQPHQSDDEEESKSMDSSSQFDFEDYEDEIAMKMDNTERYYLFKYFESNKAELDQILLEDSGVNPSEAKIDFLKGQLKMIIKTTKSIYSKVAQKVKELLQNGLKHIVVDVNENEQHYVPCLYDRRIKKDFSKKFEAKYNVILMETAKVIYVQNESRSGRGGSYSFSVQHQKIDVPYEIKPLKYSYVIVGNLLDIQNAIQGIKKSAAKYIKVDDAFPRLADEVFKKYLQSRDRIYQETAVYFISQNRAITYLGKPYNIKEA